jgi:hypothetical protein
VFAKFGIDFGKNGRKGIAIGSGMEGLEGREEGVKGEIAGIGGLGSGRERAKAAVIVGLVEIHLSKGLRGDS